MPSKVKICIGDVFQIPIDTERIGYGQVVARPEKDLPGVLFIGVFAQFTRRDEAPDVSQIVGSDILLAGNTFDAKFNHRHWPIVGNVTENLYRVALPNYKCRIGGDLIVETFDRSRYRRATPDEEGFLIFRPYSAPMLFELALKAIAGVGEWRDAFNDLEYDRLRKSSEIIV